MRLSKWDRKGTRKLSGQVTGKLQVSLSIIRFGASRLLLPVNVCCANRAFLGDFFMFRFTFGASPCSGPGTGHLRRRGTFDLVLLNTTSHSCYKNYIDVLFICIIMLWTNLEEKFLSQKFLFSTKDVSHLKCHILDYSSFLSSKSHSFPHTLTKWPWKWICRCLFNHM